MKTREFDSCLNGDWHVRTLCANGVHLTIADNYDSKAEKITVHRRVIVDGACNCPLGHLYQERELDQGIIDLIEKFRTNGIAGEEWFDEFER